MDNIIAYVDDAEYALHQLAPMLNEASSAGRQPAQWILVACPPRMSRHINKWVNHTARENWRNKWADKLFKLLTPGCMSAATRSSPCCPADRCWK